RNTGDREAEYVVLRAGQPDLLVDPRALDVAVRIARDDRLTCRRVRSGDQPPVAPRRMRPLGTEQLQRLVAQMVRDMGPPQLRREPGKQPMDRQPGPQRGPRLPLVQRQPGLGELRSSRSPTR